MATYKNDYLYEEDPMMWELHEIRNKMAEKEINCDKINKNAEKVLEKYGLKNLSVKEKANPNIQKIKPLK